MSKNPDAIPESPETNPPKVSLWELVFFFGLIGLTSFGGGLTAYIRRLAVTQKGWLTDEEFFSALAIVQILPGARVVGISVYIGNHLRGLLGATLAALIIAYIVVRNEWIFGGIYLLVSVFLLLVFLRFKWPK